MKMKILVFLIMFLTLSSISGCAQFGYFATPDETIIRVKDDNHCTKINNDTLQVTLNCVHLPYTHKQE